jgi:RNA polymerase primary sigma factor
MLGARRRRACWQRRLEEAATVGVDPRLERRVPAELALRKRRQGRRARAGETGGLPSVLSAAEEVALARRIERGDQGARDTMVESNLRLVHAVARSHRGSGAPYDDLVQAGTVGLVRAVDRFDHRRGLKFSIYAVWWIRCSILEAISETRAIRIPPSAYRQLAMVRRAEADLGRRGARRVSDGEIAQHTQLSLATVRSLRAAAQVTASLDQPVGEDATPLGDLTPDERAVDPSENAIARESRDEVWSMLRLLPGRHREVLVRRYGLNDCRAESHTEIGRRLGIGAERSRQIERDALRRLRSIAAAATLGTEAA